MEWTVDPKAEAGMRNLGIEWKIETVPMFAINREMSAERQARVGKKLNDDWIIEYATAANVPGTKFPMPILDRLKKDSFFIWSGNHRVGAAELCGDKEIKAYVVHVTDLRLMDVLPRVVNAWEGHRETREAMITHACYLIERHALEIPDVARMFGLKAEWIAIAMRAGSLRRQVEETGIKADFPASGLLKLAPLAGNKNVFKAMVKLLKDHDIGVSGEQGVQIIADVKGKTSEKEQLAQVKHWDDLFKRRNEKPKAPKESTAKGERPFKLGKRYRAIMLLQNLDKFLAGIDSATQLQLDDADAVNVATLWSSIHTKMNKLITGIRKGGAA